MPSFQDFRQVFGSWLDCRVAMGDATNWELSLGKDSKIYSFIKAVEADWQGQRVTPYALLWSFSYFPDNFEQGFENFFVKYPQWLVEKAKDGSYGQALKTLEKKLFGFFYNGKILPEIQDELRRDITLAKNVEERIIYTLASNYRLRHCGNLRQPKDLCFYAEYNRPEIINYFGIQYDPAKHNSGFIKLPGNHIVLIAKLNTSGAKEEFEYKSGFLDSENFSWQSQNKMRQENEARREITQYKERGNTIHLFVQPSSHKAACYMGVVEVIRVTGNAPMTVQFKTSQSVPEVVLESLTN
jgi:hypothetical protein